MSHDEATLFYLLLELLVGIYAGDSAITIVERLLIDILLNIVEQLLHIFLDAIAATCLLLQRIATHHLDGVVLKVTATHHQTHRHTLHFVVSELEARTLVVGIVVLHADAHSTQFVHDSFYLGIDLLQLVFALVDRNDNHLDRSQFRRQHQAVVIRVRHDKRTHQAGRNAPRSGPYILQLVVIVDELHIEALSEVLSQEVAGSALESLAILHHGLDGVSILGTCEALCLALHTLDHGHCHIVLSEVGIHIQHLLSLCYCLFLSGMSRMTFLPQELCSAKEQACTHLPAHHVSPLIHQDRQIAITLDPVLIGVPNDGL